MLQQIFDEPMFNFESLPSPRRANLLRLAADALDRIEPITIEHLRHAHQLATWAGQLEQARDREEICECGNGRRDCICDKLAAEHFLTTGDATELVALGWSRNVLPPLQNKEISPSELLGVDGRNAYQKGATPLEIRDQSR